MTNNYIIQSPDSTYKATSCEIQEDSNTIQCWNIDYQEPSWGWFVIFLCGVGIFVAGFFLGRSDI